MQKKGVAKRKQNQAEKRVIKEGLMERMGTSDWNDIIDNAITRAKESDRGFEVFRDTIGQKPTEHFNHEFGVEVIHISVNDDEENPV